MLWAAAIGYVSAGFVTTAVTLYVFPPIAGFRPRKRMVLTAVVVFTSLWPVLVGLAVWYHLTNMARERQRSRSIPRRQRSTWACEPTRLAKFSVSSKPR